MRLSLRAADLTIRHAATIDVRHIFYILQRAAIAAFANFALFAEITKSSDVAIMPFERVRGRDRAPPHQAEYAKIADASLADDLQERVHELARHFAVPAQVPVRAASVIYLGLWRLREFSEKKNKEEGRRKLTEIMSHFRPENGGNISINTSYFVADGDATAVDHGRAIQAACDIYLPRVKSRKKRCFSLLVLGSEHNLQADLPKDDEWLRSFRF